MNTLKLTIKKKWFDMILSGEKTEEYRDIKPYWFNRFMYHYGSGIEDNIENICKAYQKPRKFGYASIFDINDFNEIMPKDFEEIKFYNGGHFSDKLPNFKMELKGIEISKGKEEWGAEKDKYYFVLKLGNIIKE